ncbi:MAG: GTP 3',8-cyclase MoaA [Bacillota bacterium]
MEQLVDKWGRKIDYLRISVTDRCNLRCKYCMGENDLEFKSHKDILRYEEIIKIVEIGTKFGVNKVRITGGEPLVRKDLSKLISGLNNLNLKDISLTTNGILLKEQGPALKKAGLDRVNISIDSLKKDKYKEITRRDNYKDVFSGIETALNLDLSPVKLNIVLMKGINDKELLDFARLSIDKPLHIRFIEYMPLGQKINDAEYYATEKAKLKLSKNLELEKTKIKGNGPANYYKIKGSKGSIGFISPMSDHFCSECNRVRITADGKVRLCLARDFEFEIPKNFNEEDMIKIYKKILIKKPLAHNLTFKNKGKRNRTMSQIGG